MVAVVWFDNVVAVVSTAVPHGDVGCNAVPQWASLPSCRLRCPRACGVQVFRDVPRLPLFAFRRSSCLELLTWFVEWALLLYMH